MKPFEKTRTSQDKTSPFSNESNLDALKRIKSDYLNNNNYNSVSEGQIIWWIVTIGFTLAAIYLIWDGGGFMALFFGLFAVIFFWILLVKETKIELKGSDLIVKSLINEKHYNINSIEIKYKIRIDSNRNLGASHFMHLIMHNDKKDKLVDVNYFKDILPLIYFIQFLKRNELNKIDNLSEEEFSEVHNYVFGSVEIPYLKVVKEFDNGVTVRVNKNLWVWFLLIGIIVLMLFLIMASR